MFKGCCFGSGRAVQDSPDLSDKRRFKSDGGLKDNLNGAAAATPEDCSAKNAVVDSEFADTPGEDSLKEAAPTNDSGGGANSSDQLPAEPEENSHGSKVDGNSEQEKLQANNLEEVVATFVPATNASERLQSDASNATIEEQIAFEYPPTNATVPAVAAKSCLVRGTSRSSVLSKKHVNYNESTEMIPSDQNSLVDDDEVFSDSIAPQLPRGDMCAPYLTKRGSMPGLVALPDWFSMEAFREDGGIQEPPVTPVGRDELALKRHRLFSEILQAAQAAAEHRVRFNPWGPNVLQQHQTDCDPNQKAGVTSELESLIDRLERIVERFERTVSAAALERTEALLDSKNNQELPPTPATLEQRIVSLEQDLRDNNSFYLAQGDEPLVEDDIPTVVAQLRNLRAQNSIPCTATPPPTAILADPDNQQDQSIFQSGFDLAVAQEETEDNMSVNGFEDILLNNVQEFLALSAKIGGDVATQADFVKKAFDAQFAFIKQAAASAKPGQDVLTKLLAPTSEQIAAIQAFREKNRTSPFFNHLSAISESIPALGWVCVAPTPGPHVKEMNDAGQFYTNRVLKDWKEKDAKHVEWARSWVATLTELQKYVKQWHTTGLVWSGKGAPAVGGGAPPPPPPCGMPPPPPIMPLADLSIGDDGGAERNALFAQINQGADITKNLKKVTSDMQTHKNAGLRAGPAPFKAPGSASTGAVKAPTPAAAQVKPPVFTRDGKKWIIEYQKNNPSLVVENAEMNNIVYMFRCEGSTVAVKGKVNSIIFDSCKKCSVVLDSVISSVEFVNCQGVQMQAMGVVPTISIDKTDGVQMYLTEESKGVSIISSKSSEMNVLLPTEGGDYTEHAIPEQYRTTISGRSLKTECVESLG